MFDCTYEGLKRVAAEYLKAMPTLNKEGLDNGLKCFNLHYLGMRQEAPAYEVLCIALWEYVHKRYLEREAEMVL